MYTRLMYGHRDTSGPSQVQEEVQHLPKSLRAKVVTYCHDSIAGYCMTLLEKEIRSVMAKHVRARMCAKLKAAVKTAYGSLITRESVPGSVGFMIIEDRSYRRNGDLQYSDPRLLKVPEALMVVKPENSIEIGPGQLAYAELAVWWFLKGKDTFPKETTREGRSLQTAYKASWRRLARAGMSPACMVLEGRPA
ncbi:g1511 [Coccomyxa elongata]